MGWLLLTRRNSSCQPSGPSHHAPWVHLSQLESSKETIGGLLVPSCSLILHIFYGESVRIRWNTLIISQRLWMSQTIALAYCIPFAPFCRETLCLHVLAVVISRKAVLDVARAHGHPGSLWFPQVSWEIFHDRDDFPRMTRQNTRGSQVALGQVTRGPWLRAKLIKRKIPGPQISVWKPWVQQSNAIPMPFQCPEISEMPLVLVDDQGRHRMMPDEVSICFDPRHCTTCNRTVA